MIGIGLTGCNSGGGTASFQSDNGLQALGVVALENRFESNSDGSLVFSLKPAGEGKLELKHGSTQDEVVTVSGETDLVCYEDTLQDGVKIAYTCNGNVKFSLQSGENTFYFENALLGSITVLTTEQR
jgi:hypothetical protein